MSANFTPDQKGYKTYKSFGTFKLFVLENFPFISEDFDALTYYQMLCKIVGFLQDVITNNESLQYNQTELLDAFNELQSYVNNYFDSTDFQELVNNKLDVMAQDGTLAKLINQEIFGELNNEINDLKETTTKNTNDIEQNTNNINNILKDKMNYFRKNYNNLYNYSNIPSLFLDKFFNKSFPYFNNYEYITSLKDVSIFKNTGATTYYVSPNGSDENDGLTPETAKYNWQNVLSLISDKGTIIFEPGIYKRNQGMNGDYTNVYRNRSVNFICTNGNAILTQADDLSWQQYNSTNVYYAERTNLKDVIDISNISNNSILFLNSVENINECVETENSYYYDGTNIYVHMKNNQIPNFNNLICPLLVNNTILMVRQIIEDTTIYCENITFLGGNIGNVLVQSTPKYQATFVAKNCRFLGARYDSTKQYDNLSIQGSNSILQNCLASFGMKDGFNYHADQGKIPKAIEINCIGTYNGFRAPENLNGSCNGSTAHDGVSIIRYNGIYAYNNGPNCADVQDNTISLNYNCTAFDSLDVTENKTNSDFYTSQGSTEMYLYNCYSKNSNSKFNLITEDTSKIYVDNLTQYDTTGGTNNVINL